MTRIHHAYQRHAVEEALREYGPLTAEQLDKRLGWSGGRAQRTIANARHHHRGKAFRIVELIRAQPGEKHRPRAIYGLGPGEDVPRLGKRTRRRNR